MTFSQSKRSKGDALGHPYSSWSVAIDLSFISQLSKGVLSPAVGVPLCGQCAGMVPSQSKRGKSDALGHPYSSWSVEIDLSPVSQLSKTVLSPAVDVPLCSQ